MSLRVGRRGVSINPKYSSRACVEAPLPVCGMATKEEATKAKKGMKSRTKSTTSFLRQPTRRNFANVVIMARQAERSFVSELPKNKRSYHPAFPSKNSPYLSYPLDIVPRFSASVDPEYNIQKQSSCSNFNISGRQTSWNARFNFSSNSNFQVSPTTDKKYSFLRNFVTFFPRSANLHLSRFQFQSSRGPARQLSATLSPHLDRSLIGPSLSTGWRKSSARAPSFRLLLRGITFRIRVAADFL